MRQELETVWIEKKEHEGRDVLCLIKMRETYNMSKSKREIRIKKMKVILMIRLWS